MKSTCELKSWAGPTWRLTIKMIFNKFKRNLFIPTDLLITTLSPLNHLNPLNHLHFYKFWKKIHIKRAKFFIRRISQLNEWNN